MKIPTLPNQIKTLNRRTFMKYAGLAGLGAATTCLNLPSAEAVKFNRQGYKVSENKSKMGTFVTMTLIHESKDQAQKAMALAYDEIDRLSGLLSRFDDATPVTALNQKGYVQQIPSELYEIIGQSLAYYKMSRGNFDITVKPVVDLVHDHVVNHKGQLPSSQAMQSAVDRVGSDKLQLSADGLRFTQDGMGITLDGIAKGYIVDKAAEVILAQGVNDFLINAGGDIRCMGARLDKKAWTIAIQDPQKKNNYPDVIRLQNGAVATSGNYEVYYDTEKMFHHIVNPRTGLSPILDNSVSVVTTSAMAADALSTSVFIMAPQEGVDWIESLPRTECLIVSRKQKHFRSEGWVSANA